MGRIQESFADVEVVYKQEISKPILKRKGATVLPIPEKNDSKIKHQYTGIAQKQGDTVVKMYPSIDDIPEEIRKKVKKFCDKKMKEEILGFTYSYVKDL